MLPEGFYEVSEGTYEYDGTKEEGAKRLLAAGFVPHPKYGCDKCKLWHGPSAGEGE